jgi:hypothetical protein
MQALTKDYPLWRVHILYPRDPLRLELGGTILIHELKQANRQNVFESGAFLLHDMIGAYLMLEFPCESFKRVSVNTESQKID